MRSIITLIRCQVNGSNGSFHGVMHSLSLTQQTFLPPILSFESNIRTTPSRVSLVYSSSTDDYDHMVHGWGERERGRGRGGEREREGDAVQMESFRLYIYIVLWLVYRDDRDGHISRKHGHWSMETH